MTMSIGTHNLLDGAAEVTGFAKVLFFTEAIPSAVRDALRETYDIYVCKDQKDLIIAVSKSVGFDFARDKYNFVHPGIAKVTPHRGTYRIEGTIGSRKVAFLVHHRINAAFPPFVRGERVFRPTMWKLHALRDRRIVKRLLKRGFEVYAGGDSNAPEGVKAFNGLLDETDWAHLDRLAASTRLLHSRELSKDGSDHHRLRAVAA